METESTNQSERATVDESTKTGERAREASNNPPPLATDLVCDEFTCRECGRLVFAFPRGWVAWFGELCATCQWLPGWHLDPQLRKRLDPDMGPLE